MLYFTGDIYCTNSVWFCVYLFVFFLLNSKDDMEVLLSVGSLAKDDNLDINLKSRKSETLCSSKMPPNCHNKAEQEQHLSEDTIGSIQDTSER